MRAAESNAPLIHLLILVLYMPFARFHHVLPNLCFLWPPYVMWHGIIFLSYGFFFLSMYLLFFLVYSQPLHIGCLPYFHTWSGLSVNLGCRSEMCCTWLTENTGRKNSPSVQHRTILSGDIFATKASIDNQKKNLLNCNISPTCPHNLVNFGH